MKKMIMGLVMLSSFVGFSAMASGQIEKPLWQCGLTFKAQGGGVQFIVGSFKMRGPGTIRCVDIAGNTQVMDVKVTLGGRPLAANVALGKFRIAGLATGLGVATGPEALLGRYYTVGAQGAVLVGAGANMAFHGGAEAVTLNLGVALEKGLGVQVGLNRMMIEPLN